VTDGRNLAYWLSDPLPDESVEVLRRVKDGVQGFFRDQLEVAYLIARECVEADLENHTLAITEKGEDALEYFA